MGGSVVDCTTTVSGKQGKLGGFVGFLGCTTPLGWEKVSGIGSHLSHSSNFVLLWHWDGLEEVRGLGRKSWVCFGAVYSYHLRLHLFFVLGQGFVRVSL